MTQEQMIWNHLQEHKSITAQEAMNEYGIMRLASRISDLRRSGKTIDSEIVAGKNRFGETTHYAKYTIGE